MLSMVDARTSSSKSLSQNASKATSSSVAPKKSKLLMIVEESVVTNEWNSVLGNDFTCLSTNSTEIPAPKRFKYLNVTTPMAGLFQWIRADNSRNYNNYDYLELVPLMLPINVIITQNEDFCRRCLQPSNDIDNPFPAVDEYLEKLLTKLKQFSADPTGPTIPKLTLILLEIDKFASKAQKKLAKDQPSVVLAERIDNAIVHILLKHDIEVQRSRSVTEAVDFLIATSKALETQCDQAPSAFAEITKASRLKAKDGMTDTAKEQFELQQTWAAMLQMVPGISKEKAQAVVTEPQFSCFKRVFEAMNDETQPKKQRMLLMQSSFGKLKNGNVRKEVKLSQRVFRMMTVADSMAALDSSTSTELIDDGNGMKVA